MAIKKEKIVKWFDEFSFKLRNLGRMIRGEGIRLFLRLCLVVFFIEKLFNPPLKSGCKKILVIVYGGLGDCLLFDSLFRRLKESYDCAQIEVLTGCFESMWEQLESVENRIYFAPRENRNPINYVLFFRRIYRSSYDIVAEGISMLPHKWFNRIFISLVFDASRAAIRIGRLNVGKYPRRKVQSGFIGREEMAEMAKKKAGDERNPFLTHILSLEPPEKRQYHESLRIFSPLGLIFQRDKKEPFLRPNPKMDLWAQRLLRTEWAAEKDVIVGLSVEVTKPIKEWNLDNFISVVKMGIRDKLKFVLIGLTPRENTNLKDIFPEESFLNLSGMTTLSQMIAIVRNCNIFLSCDSGPAHIAQACQIPTVVLFGPSNEMEFGPANMDLHTLITPPGNLSCRPCVLGPCIRGKTCMQLISLSEVYDKLAQKAKQFSLKGRKSLVEAGRHAQPNFTQLENLVL